jgi:hypothetical protein
MMAEYDKGKIGDINPEQEVMEDLAYYKALVEKDKREKK